jgi:hypothetical protein
MKQRINRLLMLGKRGLGGPLFQRIGSSLYGIGSPGKRHGIQESDLLVVNEDGVGSQEFMALNESGVGWQGITLVSE